MAALPLAVRVTVCYDSSISNTNHQGAATMDMARIDRCASFILNYIDEVIPETDPTNEAAALVEFAAQTLADNEGAELTALEAFWVRRMISMYLQGALDHQGAQTD